MTDEKLIALGKIVAKGMVEINKAETDLPEFLEVDAYSTELEFEGEEWRIAVSRPDGM